MTTTRNLLVTMAALASACGGTKTASAPSEIVPPSPVPSAGQEIQLETSAGPLRITPIWHGTIGFTFGEVSVVIDPWSKAPEGRLPKADLVLITDIHPDHFDVEAIEGVRKEGTMVVAPQAVVDLFPSAQVLANGEERTAFGIGIEAIPMYNLQRGPEEGKRFHDKGRGNGYVLSFGETRIYISGDTECTPEMRALENIDLAFVCMNLPYTMPPEEAAECIRSFRPKVVTPFHYRGSDLDVLSKALADEGDIKLEIRDFYAQE